MLNITSSITIDESELHFTFKRASGPGGQNVNKVATAVQLRFDVGQSPSLRADVKERLIQLAGSRMTGTGELVINASRHRTQEQNRKDAVDRFIELVREAATPPKHRVGTKTPRRVHEFRLGEKRKRSETKRKRGRVDNDND